MNYLNIFIKTGPYVFCIYSLLFCLPLSGQTDAHFDHYTIEQGLSSSRVRSFLQDKDGFVWIGTASGLNWFNAYEFTTLHANADDRNGLRHNGVHALLEDKHDNLWVGTKKGLQLMNREEQLFFPTKEDQIASVDTIKNVLCLLKSSQGDIWVGASNGLFRIKLNRSVLSSDDLKAAIQDGSCVIEVLNPASAEAGYTRGDRIWSLNEDTEGRLWIGTNTGLSCYDLHQNKFVGLPFPQTDKNRLLFEEAIQALAVMPEGTLWLGTEQGLFTVDINRGKCSKFVEQTSKGIDLKNDFITELVADQKGNLWMGTDGSGVFRWNAKEQSLLQYKNSLTDPYSLIDNNIESMYLDPNNGLWIGTHKGVSYYNPHRKPFKIIRAGLGENAIRQGTIEDILVDGNTIWIGIDDGGLSKYQMTDGEVTNYKAADNVNNGLKDNDVVALVKDNASNLWIGTWGGGISRLSPQGQFYHFLDDPTIPPMAQDLFISTFFKDSQGDIWIGTVDNGLIHYQVKEKLFQFFETRINTPVSIPGSWVIDINEDTAGNIWVVTTAGVFTYAPSKGQVNPITWPDSIAADNIMVLHPSEDGTMWLGSQQGLIYYSPTEAARIMTVSDGLADAWVKSIEEDGNGNLWLGTGKGISKYNLNDHSFKNYDSSDGLPIGEFSKASAKTASGDLLFGNINGLTLFDPDSIQAYTSIPKVAITELRLFNQPVSIDRGETTDKERNILLGSHISYAKAISLKHWQNYLSFEFAALEYLNPSKSIYQYRLKGLQEDWLTASAEYRIASYTNLAPGKYTFQVMAGNTEGAWSDQPAEIEIFISPPWWNTPWAFLLYAFVLAGGIILALRIMKSQWALQAELDFNQRESQRLKELDHFKSQLYTNLTHEFRTPLTVILGMAEQIRTAPKTYLEQGIQLIENNGRSLLRLINQLLDLSKLDNNVIQSSLIQGDIVAYLRFITASFQTYANSKNLSLRFRSQLEQLEMDYDPDHLQQVMYNLISNAIKFTPSGGEIVVRLQREQDHLKIIIEDNGIGIPEAAQAHIFDRFYQVVTDTKYESINNVAGTGIGLAHTRELVKLMQGSISVESELGQGTAFTIYLPIAHQAASRSVEVGKVWQAPVTIQHPRPSKTDSGKPRLLIIEDNPDVVLYLKGFLESVYQLDLAYNGKVGIEKALENIPDLIISDIMMPEKDGYQVCDFLKRDERTSHIPIVLLTAKTGMNSRITGLKRGADAYLSKPFYQEELLVRLEKLLEQQQRMAAYLENKLNGNGGASAPSQVEEEVIEIEDAFIQKVRSIIAEHYPDENFSLPALCTYLGMSRSQLYRKMQALTNTAPSTYLRIYRLRAAKKLLEEGKLSVSEVSWQVGYKDPAHFSKSFLDEFGHHPSDFLK
ncbi:MAG TPA: two-component regulator propeller domain-containing protein [Saprospiraceae bacterium]|nr:two-component regulator propeller domain-containing protein [Saprospiraceae bacterium]